MTGSVHVKETVSRINALGYSGYYTTRFNIILIYIYNTYNAYIKNALILSALLFYIFFTIIYM